MNWSCRPKKHCGSLCVKGLKNKIKQPPQKYFCFFIIRVLLGDGGVPFKEDNMNYLCFSTRRTVWSLKKCKQNIKHSAVWNIWFSLSILQSPSINQRWFEAPFATLSAKPKKKNYYRLETNILFNWERAMRMTAGYWIQISRAFV